MKCVYNKLLVGKPEEEEYLVNLGIDESIIFKST
jgi:hypothetical protein